MAKPQYTPFVQLAFSFTEPEIWRPVVGHEGYEVSTLGRVRSLDRKYRTKSKDLEKTQTKFGKVLKPQAPEAGPGALYQRVLLHSGGKKQHRLVHHLVLEAFVGPRPEGYVTNHRNFDPRDNRLSNLEWVTQRSNLEYSKADGRLHHSGEKNHHSRFTAEDILLMRRLAKNGMSKYAIARQFNTPRAYVQRIIKRQFWAHLPEEE